MNIQTLKGTSYTRKISDETNEINTIYMDDKQYAFKCDLNLGCHSERYKQKYKSVALRSANSQNNNKGIRATVMHLVYTIRT